MNPIEFQNNNYVSLLEANKNRECVVRVLGTNGFFVKGTFMGIAKCNAKELTEMAGFIANVPVYKILVMADDNGRIVPTWINILLIDDISDIKFL